MSAYRVSTRERASEGNGWAAQRRAIQAVADQRGRQAEWIGDAGHSGRDTNRLGLLVALALLKAKQADGSLVANLDRLSRSVPDFGRLLDSARRQGWSVTALDVDVDTSTPTGELVATS